jgi:hypothetical protein
VHPRTKGRAKRGRAGRKDRGAAVDGEVTCPAGHFALSGGFDIQGSVTASYRSSSTGDPTGNTSWTIRQSSGASLSGTVYVYCTAS